MSQKIDILRNVYRKIDGMTLSFGLPTYNDDIADIDIERYFMTDYNDALREFKLKSLSDIEEMSDMEFYIEERIVYHALRRLRLAGSVYFKFSTAVDGKTIDKTQIPRILNSIIGEYDREYRAWRRSRTSGSIWTMDSTITTSGNTI